MPRPVDPTEFADELPQNIAPAAKPRRQVDPSEFADAPEAPKSFVDKIGGWRGLGGLGIRALSGILGVEGGAPGAAISGIGETGAEMLEKGTWNPLDVDPARVGVAAATGAVPFGKVVQGGRVAASALRSGALSGAGETGREFLSGEKFDPKAVGLSTLIGGVAGGGGSKLGTMFGVAGEKLPQEAAAAERVPTARTGRQQENALRQQVGRQSQAIEQSTSHVPKLADERQPSGTRTFDLGDIESPMNPVLATEGRPPAAVGPGAQMSGMPAEANNRVQGVIAREAAAAEKAASLADKQAAVQAKAAEKAAAQQRIDEQIALEGRVQGPATIGENATGEKSMRIPYIVEKTAEEAGPAAGGAPREFTPDEYARFNAPEPSPAAPPTGAAPQSLAEARGVPPPAAAPEPGLPGNVADMGQFKEDKFNELYQKVWNRTASPAEAAEAERLFNELAGAEVAPKLPSAPGNVLPFGQPEAAVPGAAKAPRAPRAPARQKAPEAPTPQSTTPGFAEPPIAAQPPPTAPLSAPPPVPAAGPVEAAAPQSLDELFGTTKKPFGPSTEVNSVSKDYGTAKAAEAAGGPSADAAYEAMVAARQRAGLETAPRTGRAAAPVEAAPAAGGQDWIAEQNALVDAAQQEPALADRLRKLAEEEKGALSPGLQRLLGAGAGAAVGAPVGAAIGGDEDPYGALKGALGGAVVGGYAGQGANALVNARNSMLLASGNPASKNIIGDIGGMTAEMLKAAITPGQGGYAKDLFLNHPVVAPGQYLSKFKEALLHPESGATASVRDIVGEALDKPMELIYRPYNASNVAIKDAMQRGGASQKAIEQASGIATPETATMQSWLGLQKHPLFRMAFPFQKIASNVLEGSRNIPGVSLLAGNPADKWQRGALGGLQMAVGAGSELYDEGRAADDDPTSNWTKGVRAGALGPKYSAPYAAGYGLAAIANEGPAKALSELVNLIPGARAVLPASYPNESADEYAYRVLSGPIGQMIPSFLKPGSDTGSVR